MVLKEWILRLVAVRHGVKVGARFHVGPGSVVWAPRSLVIGDDVYIGKHVTVEVDGVIGDGVAIANGVGIVGRSDHDIHQEGSTIRAAAWVGDGCNHLSSHTVIGSDVWIGYGAIVLSGVQIGDSAIVAAGALVTKDVPANTVVAGIPARSVHKRFTEAEFQRHWMKLELSGVRRRTVDEWQP